MHKTRKHKLQNVSYFHGLIAVDVIDVADIYYKDTLATNIGIIIKIC